MSTSSLATQMATELVMEASRVGCALRSIASVMTNEHITLDEGTKAGLFEAVTLLGEHLEYYAADRQTLAESLTEELRGADEH